MVSVPEHDVQFINIQSAGLVLGLSDDVLHGYFLITDIFQLDMLSRGSNMTHINVPEKRADCSVHLCHWGGSTTTEPYETPQL